MSGSELWKLHMSMGGSGTLHLSNKGPRMALTTDGKLGVGVKVPMEAIHIQGSGLLESSSKPVFVSVQRKSAGWSAIEICLGRMASDDKWSWFEVGGPRQS